MGKLTAKHVQHAKPGRHADGKGLYLLVKPKEEKGRIVGGARSWVLRIVVGGRRRDFGLGPVDLVTLQEARDKAIEGRRLVRAGLDPGVEWKRSHAATPNFAAVARQYHETNKGGWKNVKHAAQWLSTLETYAFPALGRKLPDEIDAPAIWSVLGPIWQTKPETARRVRQRIGTVLDYAAAHGWRATDAPMRALAQIVSRQVQKAGHHSAMAYDQIPAFMAKLRQGESSVGRMALQFLILTAARSGEVRGASWEEINGAQWDIPGDRMKTGEPHRVPLSDPALMILSEARGLVTGRAGEPIFPGFKGLPMSDGTMAKALRGAGGEGFTVHGMRSAFKDWAREKCPSVPDDVSEAALAHKVANKTKRSYQRTDFLEARRKVMAAWAEYLAGTSSNVVRIAS